MEFGLGFRLAFPLWVVAPELDANRAVFCNPSAGGSKWLEILEYFRSRVFRARWFGVLGFGVRITLRFGCLGHMGFRK